MIGNHWPAATGAGPGRPLLAPARLLTLLHREGPITRAHATEQLGLARSAVGTALAELAELGLAELREPRPEAEPSRGRGRPSPLIGLDPNGPTVLVAQVRPDRIVLASVGLGQQIHQLSGHRLEVASTRPVALADRLAELTQRAADQEHRAGRRCLAAGVSLPATVRERDGHVPSSLHLGWSDVPFGGLLAERLPSTLPVSVHRGSGLAALAEYRYGAGRGADDLLALNCEHVGIGGGFVTGGQVFAGSGYAIEAGHVIVEPAGRPCACGARGCLEMYADARALLRTAGLEPRPDDDLTELTAAVLADAGAGAGPAREAVGSAARSLAAGLVGLVNTLSPDRVVLIGFLARLHDAAPDLITGELTRSSIVARTGQVTVGTGILAHPAILGTADQAFEPLLADPRAALMLTP